MNTTNAAPSVADGIERASRNLREIYARPVISFADFASRQSALRETADALSELAKIAREERARLESEIALMVGDLIAYKPGYR